MITRNIASTVFNTLQLVKIRYFMSLNVANATYVFSDTFYKINISRNIYFFYDQRHTSNIFPINAELLNAEKMLKKHYFIELILIKNFKKACENLEEDGSHFVDSETHTFREKCRRKSGYSYKFGFSNTTSILLLQYQRKSVFFLYFK